MALKTKSIAIAALGTMLEYYDYAIFSIFLPIIAPVFFPAHSKYDALIMGFYAVLISSIARPLGGLVFGYIGDRFGRKVALLISIYGIAFATLMVGVTPGFATIGIFAMIILTIIRSVQMLCYGGEYSGAGIYVVELANGRKEGLIGGLLSAMALVGSVIASVAGLIITYANKENPNWRLAFILGGIMGIVAIVFRRNMTETASHDVLAVKVSLKQLFSDYPHQIFAGVCIGGFITLPFSTVLSFVNPMLVTKGFINNFQFMQLQFLLSSVAVITLILSGLAADKFSPKKVMTLATILLVILGFPLCFLLNSYNIGLILIAEIVLIIINEILLGPSNAYLKSIFPMQVRYRGSAFSFCLGMAIVGGLTPIIESFLFAKTGSLCGISIWLIFISSLTLFSLRNINNH